MEQILTTRGKPVTVQVGARLPYPEYVRLLEAARAEGVRVSDVLRDAVRLKLAKLAQGNAQGRSGNDE